jgi:hypothetical protein
MARTPRPLRFIAIGNALHGQCDIHRQSALATTFIQEAQP